MTWMHRAPSPATFSGAVYGPDGSEAAGVFSFDGGDAGAFTGAFGGRDDDQ